MALGQVEKPSSGFRFGKANVKGNGQEWITRALDVLSKGGQRSRDGRNFVTGDLHREQAQLRQAQLLEVLIDFSQPKGLLVVLSRFFELAGISANCTKHEVALNARGVVEIALLKQLPSERFRV
jgi:hypothetical protein